MSLLDTFLATAERHSVRTAIVDGRGARTSFGELARWSAELAVAWRRRGIGKGDRVLVAVPLDAGLYASLAALWRLGAVAVFPEPAMGLKGLRHAAATMQPKAYLSAGWLAGLRYVVPELWSVTTTLGPAMREAGAHIAERLEDEHPALISFTSGSTGAPKAIARSHGFLMAQHRAVSPMLVPTRDDECDLIAFPVFVLVNLALGTTSVLPSWKVTRHDQAKMGAVTRFIGEAHVTRLIVPPSIGERLADSGVPKDLGAIFTGGGPVFPDVLLKLQGLAPRTEITAVYGSTEAEPIAHIAVSEIGAADWDGMRNGQGLIAGAPVAQVRMRLVDDEITVTGAHVNKSYVDMARNASTKLTLDGEVWHRTGDAGRLDAQGRLWLLGRLDGRAGALSPFCVEAAARFWPGLRRSALASIGGEAVLAVEGDTRHQPEWARRGAAMGIARVVVLDRIPLDRRHRSKVDYAALRQRLARG